MVSPITDPNLIAHLESGDPAQSGQPVNDPNLIAHLEGGAPKQSRSNPSLPLRISGDIMGGVANAGQELANAPARIGAMLANAGQAIPQLLGVPGATNYDFNKMFGLDQQPNTDFGKVFGVNDPNLADKITQGAAGYMPYLMGGEAAALPKVVDSIPALSKIPWFNKIVTANINQAPTDLIYGATQSKDPAEGALAATAAGRAIGIPLSVAGKGASKAWENKGELFNFMRPQKHAEEMLNGLGGGKSLEENSQGLAGDISGAFNKVSSEVKQQFKPVFDKYGNSSVYKDLNPAMSSYRSLDNDAFSGYDRNLNKLHDEFIKNPSLQNAHNLQSQLGSAVRKLEKSDARGNLSIADRSKMQGYQDARSAVKKDINTFLTSKDPRLADQYNDATQSFAERVVPYLENPKIAPIAKGEVTNPKNIAAIFKNPEPELQQIVDDIGSSASNKILYASLGKTKTNLTPEKLSTAIGNLDKEGLGSYITPEFTKQADSLSSKMMTKKGIGTVASAVTGGIGGHALGIPYGETLGATAGLTLSPMINSLVRKLPARAASEAQVPFNAMPAHQQAVDHQYLSQVIHQLLRGVPAQRAVNAINTREQQ